MEVVVKGTPKIEVSFNTDLGLRNKADKQGIYPDLVAGDLAGHGESVPAEFSFRASGGKSIKDGRAYIKSIKGNSVVWNQQVDTITPQDCDLSENGNLLTITPQGTFPGVKNVVSMNIIENHVYICISHRIGGGFLNVNCGGYDGDTNVPFSAKKRDYGFTVYYYGETQPITITRPILIDLTQMFGAGDEPTSIEEYEARKPIVEDEYAYNEGEVIHMNTESIKSVGDNALNADRSLVFDFVGSYGNYEFINTEDAFVGISADGYINNWTIDYAEKIEGGFRFRSNGGGYGIGLFVKALPNEEYSVSYASDNGRIAFGFYDKGKNLISHASWGNHFTTPSNCEYIMLCLRDNEVVNIDISFTDIMLTLVHSGWKQDTDAGYQEYWEDTLPLPIISKYFPQGMKSAGSACDVIDCKKKQAITNVGVASNLSFSQMQEGVFYVELPNMKLPTSTLERMNGILTNRYAVETDSPSVGNMADKSVIRFADGNIYIKDMSYTNADEFNAANTDLVVCYELAEPIVTEIDEPISIDYRVADFGTEQAQSSVPSAAFRADIIYQFNAVDMIRELWLKVQELEKRL